MDFRRIDKNTVQCRMTEEEMQEYGFQIEDFFTDQDKAREFLEQLVERAEEEVGYEVESGMVSMQLMRMPDNSLTITFSDRNPDGLQNMLYHIQQMAEMIDDGTAEEILENLQQSAEQRGADSGLHSSENIEEFNKKHMPETKEQKEAYRKHMQQIEKLQREKEKRLINAAKVYAFDNMDSLEQFAMEYSSKKNISSKLYRDKQAGKYYLLVKKGKLKMEEYRHLCRRLMDYGALCTEQPFVEQYCKEHFQCMINKHALRILQEYCQ